MYYMPAHGHLEAFAEKVRAEALTEAAEIARGWMNLEGNEIAEAIETLRDG